MWDRHNASLFSNRITDVVKEKEEANKKEEVKLPAINEGTIPASLIDQQENLIAALFNRNPKLENTESISKLLEVDSEKAVTIIKACREVEKDPNYKIIFDYIMVNYITSVFAKRDKNRDWQTESNTRSENIEKAKVVFGIINSIKDIAKTEIPESLDKKV